MQTLISKAVQGDVEAFLELMDRNSLAMYKVARAISLSVPLLTIKSQEP